MIADSSALVPIEFVRSRILILRGEKVLMDSELSEMYGVQTKVLLQQVTRNLERFPADFMFQVTRDEALQLRAISATSAKRPLTRLPYAFTEQGVAMLSSVLRSPRAVQVNIAIMRAFVQLRQMIASHADLARKLATLERKYDEQFRGVFEAIQALMNESEASIEKHGRKIGFGKPVKT